MDGKTITAIIKQPGERFGNTAKVLDELETYQNTVGGYIETLPVEAEAFYRTVRFGLDMVFNPAETGFMRKIRENGGFALGGRSMLFYQGMRSYEIWTGREFFKAQADQMHEAFLKASEEVLS